MRAKDAAPGVAKQRGNPGKPRERAPCWLLGVVPSAALLLTVPVGRCRWYPKRF